MEDNLGLLRSWICVTIEEMEETYQAPAGLEHIDCNDLIDVLNFVKEEVDALTDFVADEEEESEEDT